MHIPIAMTWDGRPVDSGERVDLRLHLTMDDLVIEVAAPFHMDPAPSKVTGPTWKLWEHEVVELFVLGAGDAYTEIELGPHEHHLVLRLVGERNIVSREHAIAFTARIAEGRWVGTAVVSRSLLPPLPWRGNAFAIHGVDGRRRHLAWKPLGTAEPDFHHIEGFVDLEIGQ